MTQHRRCLGLEHLTIQQWLNQTLYRQPPTYAHRCLGVCLCPTSWSLRPPNHAEGKAERWKKMCETRSTRCRMHHLRDGSPTVTVGRTRSPMRIQLDRHDSYRTMGRWPIHHTGHHELQLQLRPLDRPTRRSRQPRAKPSRSWRLSHPPCKKMIAHRHLASVSL